MKKLGVAGLALLTAMKMYAIELPPAETLIGIRLEGSLIITEYDTDGDGYGDHRYDYINKGIQQIPNGANIYAGKLLRYMIDNNHNKRYDEDEIFPMEPEELPEDTNPEKMI